MLKESTGNVGDLGLIPSLVSLHGGGHSNPLQYSCMENPHGQRSLAVYSPWGCKELDMTEWFYTGYYSDTIFSFKWEKFFSSNVSKKMFFQKKSWLNNILNQKVKIFARNRSLPATPPVGLEALVSHWLRTWILKPRLTDLTSSFAICKLCDLELLYNFSEL